MEYTDKVKTKLLIFGITGDLSTRKLLPALDKMIKTGDFDNLEVIGVSRRDVDMAELLQASLGSTELASKVLVYSMNLAVASDYLQLRDFIALKNDEQLLVYLSVPSTAAAQIVDFLGQAGISTPNTKLLFEKPFGVDYVSARDVITMTARYYSEDQIYRIDHYLAKEMAQNIVAFRGGNALFSQLWNKAAIEKIEIIATEKIGIETRAQFYEQTGALRDVIQGHLMQLLALTLMNIPERFDWNELPAARLAALKQLRPADPQKAIRAQYEGYQSEVENPGSLVETFVSLQLASTDSRWEGVPLILTTGKALDKKTTEVRVYFQKLYEAQSNRLIFRIQPNEGVEIELFIKKPGYEREFEAQKLAFAYPEDTILPDAYEQVLVDAIRARKSLFTSSDEVLQSWQILQPVLDAWNMSSVPPVGYVKGTAMHTVSSVE